MRGKYVEPRGRDLHVSEREAVLAYGRKTLQAEPIGLLKYLREYVRVALRGTVNCVRVRELTRDCRH